jgi:hypothetical protein
MHLKTARLVMLLFLALPAAAQFTTVTGTVTDPNGVPYAFGTITPILVTVSGSGTPTLGGFPYAAPTQPTGLDKNGSFVVNLGDNNVIVPAGSKWNFQVCSATGTVQPSGGKGPVCFQLAAPITITGASQSITANLAAVPPPALSFAGAGAGTVTNTGGALTANAVVLGNGGSDTKVSTGITTNGVSELDVGLNGGAGGVLGGFGSTSGKSTLTFPAVAGTNTNPIVFSNVLQVPAVSLGGITFGAAGPSVGSANASDLQFAAGGSNKMSINSNGNIVFQNSGGGWFLNGGTLSFSSASPTIAGAGCGGSGASIPLANGTPAFTVNVGTAPTSGGCTISLPAASTDWVCNCRDRTTKSTTVSSCEQSNSAASTNSAVLQIFTDVAVAAAPVANDILRVSCFAY